MEKKKTEILYVTHRIDETIMERYTNIKNSVKNISDVYLLFNKGEEEITLPEGILPYYFDTESLNLLNYEPIEETIIPGSNHFAVLQFFQDYPHYDYYWNIEYDVVYTGNWTDFFFCFNSIDADFITSHIERFPDKPHWYWWNSLHLDNLSLQKHQLIRSFNPVYRISNKALAFLNNLLKGGNNWGHHEVVIPTVLHYFDFKILDFGGNGEFVLPQFEEKFYLMSTQYADGTMRHIPIKKGEFSVKIYYCIL